MKSILSIGMKLAAFICRLHGCDAEAIPEKVQSEGLALVHEFKRIAG